MTVTEKKRAKSDVRGYVYFIIALVVIVAGYTIITRTVSGTDLPFAVVSSGSMEPNIPTGSLIFIQKVNPADIVAGPPLIGDVVVYKLPDTTITNYLIADKYDPAPISHRVISKTLINGTYYFVTKGDANSFPDNTYPNGLVPQDAIIGKIVWHVPYLGYPFLWIQNPFVLVTVVIILIIIIIIPMGADKGKGETDGGTSETKNGKPGTPSPVDDKASQY
jgi:signal peptidase